MKGGRRLRRRAPKHPTSPAHTGETGWQFLVAIVFGFLDCAVFLLPFSSREALVGDQGRTQVSGAAARRTPTWVAPGRAGEE